jgi:hypothetical protein
MPSATMRSPIACPRSMVDREWLLARGFVYVTLPEIPEAVVHFKSIESARRCADLFYGRNPRVRDWIDADQSTDVPLSVIGMPTAPEFCWRRVQKVSR